MLLYSSCKTLTSVHLTSNHFLPSLIFLFFLNPLHMLGFLHKADQYDILYKPVQAGNKGQREVAFYEGLFSLPEEELSRDLQRLKKLIPGYYGICDITDRAGETCILFTNVCVRVCLRLHCFMGKLSAMR